MISVLILLAVAVFSEAGVLHQPGIGIGLHYPPGNSNAVRPAQIIRSHIAPPFRSSTALNSQYIHEPLRSTTILTSHSHAVPISHAPIGPGLIGTRIVPPSGSIGHSALTSLVLQPTTALGSSIFTPSLANSHASPPLVLNTDPISNDVISLAPTITHIPTVVSPAPISAPTSAIHNSQTALNPGVSADYKIVHEVQEIQPLPEKSVSYTISENDYQYLKQRKAEGNDSPYSIELETSSANEKHQNTHIHHEKDRNANVEVDNALNGNAAFIDGYQQHYSEPSVLRAPEPIVNKHIYFHVPPPDFDEPEPKLINIPAPKKTYNIVFIKVPSQEQQNHVYLQQLLHARQTQAEEKTLIYVLSKKQDPQQVVLPPTPKSSPEVFFVKYRTRPGDFTEIKDDLIEDPLLEDISPILERKRRLGDNQTDKPKKL